MSGSLEGLSGTSEVLFEWTERRFTPALPTESPYLQV